MAKTRKTRKPAATPADSDDAAFYTKRVWEMTRDLLRDSLDRCLDEMQREGAGGNGQWMRERISWFSEELISALDKGDISRAVYWALRFGSLTTTVLGWDGADALFRERKRENKLRQQTATAKSAADAAAQETADRVALLMKRKGLSKATAMEKVAKERGVSVRTVRRYMKRPGQV